MIIIPYSKPVSYKLLVSLYMSQQPTSSFEYNHVIGHLGQSFYTSDKMPVYL